MPPLSLTINAAAAASKIRHRVTLTIASTLGVATWHIADAIEPRIRSDARLAQIVHHALQMNCGFRNADCGFQTRNRTVD